MASESSIHKAAQAWCMPSTEKIDMIPELAEAFAETLDTLKKQHSAKIELRDVYIAKLEAENDVLGARLHDLYSDKMHGKYPNKLPRILSELHGNYVGSRESVSLKAWFWVRYVNGGSRIWRVLFEVCNSGGRLWRAMVRVGRRRAKS